MKPKTHCCEHLLQGYYCNIDTKYCQELEKDNCLKRKIFNEPKYPKV